MYGGIKFDLNPLAYRGGLVEFGNTLRACLRRVLNTVQSPGIHCLIQSAGVYDFGSLLEHDPPRRANIYGVNLLGHMEVLYNIMALNTELGFDNPKGLTVIDVGSTQGLHIRARRPLYAPSKAAGIDFCNAIHMGGEVQRCIYFAPAPIDTHMLHRNHWITKAGGSLEFFERVFGGSRERYRSIFIDCSEWALLDAISELSFDLQEVRQSFEKYCSIRKESFRGEFGVLDPDECADILVKIVIEPSRYPSGVYVASVPRGQRTEVKMLHFEELSRWTVMERAGQLIM